MKIFLEQLLKIRLETLKLKLESRDYITGARLEQMSEEKEIEIEREIKEIKEKLKLMDIENDF